jgi:transcriptional regulator with GAF, ATPase, and Fis domain
VTPEEEDLSHPVPRTAVRGLRRQATIFWHGVIAWALAPGWFAKLLLTATSLGLLVWPIVKLGGWKQPATYVGVWILVAAWKAYRELSPKNMQLLQRNYLARKLMVYRLVRDMERATLMSKDEIAAFQRDALHLIATYVRDHRADTKGMQIFANLLVEDRENLRVVARDRLHRESSVLLSKYGALAWAALSTGEPKLTGDVYADYPETANGKPYRSILVIPVRRGSKVLGVVSIDSTRCYHFDREMKNLVEYLSPYVAFLAWTLEAPWDMVAADPDTQSNRGSV